MIEKKHLSRCRGYVNGYFKPRGKTEKRFINKMIRKLPIGEELVYRKIGVVWDWN